MSIAKLSPIFYIGLFIKLLAIIVWQIYTPPISLWEQESPLFEAITRPFHALDVTISQVSQSTPSANFGSALTLLMSDLLVLSCLLQLVPHNRNTLLLSYWLSPVILISFYVLNSGGEILPVFLLLFALTLIKRNILFIAGLFVGSSIAANNALMLLAPFIVIYLWQQKRVRHQIPRFALGFTIAFGVILIVISYYLNKDLTESLNFSKIQNGFNWTFAPSVRFNISLFAILYFTFVYSVWRLRRICFATLSAVLAIANLSFMIITGEIAFWFISALPYLSLYATSTTHIGRKILFATQLAIVVCIIHLSPVDWLDNVFGKDISIDSSGNLQIISTILVSFSVILISRVLSEGVLYDGFFRITRRPLVLGISGDSGTGKDTLARAVGDLFGNHSVTYIYGDAYHKWPRDSPMWRKVTHLNPLANNLSQLTKDVIAVSSGETLYRRHYEHTEGRFTYPIPVKSNDVIFVTGLHALFDKQLRERLDLKIFLKTDASLRLYWKLRRDSTSRQQDPNTVRNIDRIRDCDRKSYIYPQEEHAQLVFGLMAVNPEHLERRDPPSPLPLKLTVIIREAIDHEPLLRCLIALCGLQIDWELADDGNTLKFVVDGEVSAEDIELSANRLFYFDELLSIKPKWCGDMLGVMQMIVLTYAQQKLTKRIRQ